jgi:16S rRNA C967 or C1407 C5-methylase (RsmB/RsmF family)
MKSSTFILFAFLFIHLNACSQDFKKLSASEVDKSKVKIAQDFASTFLTKLKNNETYQFEDKAIDAVKNSLTEETQKLLYEQLKNQFGDFQSLEYAETWVPAASKANQIIRLKGDFAKSNKILEIRTVLDESNKIAGFWIKPWSDVLQ